MPESPILLVAEVALDVRAAGAKAVYSYLGTPDLHPGSAVIVPLGTRQALGYVIELKSIAADQLGYPAEKLKSVSGCVENLNLPTELIDLVRFTAEEYMSPLSVALSSATPPGALERIVTEWRSTSVIATDLTPLQKEVFALVEDQGGKLTQSAKIRLEPKIIKTLRSLVDKGLLERVATISAAKSSKNSSNIYRLSKNNELVSEWLKANSKKRPAQALTIYKFQEQPELALSIPDIKITCGVTEAIIRQLIESDVLEKVDLDSAPPAIPPNPNPAQTLAIDAIVQSITESEARKFLLYGVTGSGKTEVYLRAAAEAVRLGRQVLYLVPEIALATQAVGLLRERFGRRVAILHSELTPTERLDNWMAIRTGEAAIVLGARSAIFAPLSNLGLIVLDEEHEQSYKQESSPRYHTKMLAEFLGRAHRCPLVLGSATPSIESYFEAETDMLTLLTLPHRAASAKLPDVEIVDLTGQYRAGKPSLFAPGLADRLIDTRMKGKQSILFLNRRAYAPFILCRDCGEQFHCPNCAVSLTYSRKTLRLRCHHCGHQERPPDTCPKCQGNRLSPLGVGTEKVEEAVLQLMPEARVARLDRDITQKKGELERILAEFGSGEIDVLVGTQMVAKGLNFPNVTLVGVIAADLSLGIPDFRAGERTFQLLSQVAGRAGRGKHPGEVVIQTFNPAHPSITAAQKHDYLEIYEAQRIEREEALYPPFCRLINIVFAGENHTEVWTAARTVATVLTQHNSQQNKVDQLSILGPADCALERINNRWRAHILIKAANHVRLEEIGRELSLVHVKGVQILIDVDAYSLS